jgi:hypothetical protein
MVDFSIAGGDYVTRSSEDVASLNTVGDVTTLVFGDGQTLVLTGIETIRFSDGDQPL